MHYNVMKQTSTREEKNMDGIIPNKYWQIYVHWSMCVETVNNYKRMFCRTCESPAQVYNIENGQPNRSTMEREGTTYVITVSPVPG